MDITVEKTGDGALTILALAGELDARSYLDVIARVQQLYADGARRLLLDLSELTFLSSAGLVALHSAVRIMRGQAPPDPEEGWNVFHAMSNEVESQAEAEAAVRVLCPQPRVSKALEMSGFSRQLPTFTDRDEALASFNVES